jgi:hypothetical protein
MANAIIQVPVDSTGKKVDTSELTVGVNTVERQRIVLSDDAAAAGLAAVVNAAPTTEYGLVTRNIPSGTQPISGTVTANAGTGTFTVGDGGASLTVDAPVGTPVAVRVTNDSVGFATIATDRTTAAAPFSVELSDGAAFYTGVKTGQLPSALVGSRLDVNIGAFGAQPAASHTRNAAFSQANAVGGELDDTSPAAATEGNVSPVRITAQRGFHVNLRDNSGGELGVLATPLRVDPTGTTAQPVSGTITASQATASSLNAQVVGNIASDGVDSGNPVKIGGIARQANPTAVAALDRVDLFCDDVGRQVVQLHQARDLVSHQSTQIVNSTAETTIISQTASEFHDIIALVITNQTATAVNVTIKDSTAGTTRMIVALAANGGAVICPSTPIPQLAAVNNNWTATLSNATTTVNVFAQFAKNV